jgi:hypothetical protein
MAYSDIYDVQTILSQSLTSGSTPTASVGGTTPGKLTQIGRQLALNVIPPDQVEYYIRLADAHINAALSQQYVTPLFELSDIEMGLLDDISEYNDVIVLTNAAALSAGDRLLFFNGINQEHHRIKTVSFDGTVTLKQPIDGTFAASSTRVLRVKFADPIPYLSARLAAAAVYDKYFSAQADPDKSQYGELVRKEAVSELNNIREGRTILHGVDRIGWRFANPNLIDRYNMKGSFDQDGTRSDQQQ